MRFRPLLVPTLMVVPMLAVLLGLGTWQLERRAWKLGLIAQMQERLSAPPTSLDALEQAAGGAVDYRPVEAAGRFDNSKELYWFTPGPAGEAGYHVIAPLIPASGPAVLVDRGFIPAALKDPASRALGLIEGPVTIRGIARESQKPGGFTPKDEPAQHMVFARDVPAMAAEMGVAPVAPFFIEADGTPNPGGYPLGGQTQVTLRNEHLQYAVTWYALAAILLAVYFVYHRGRGRLDV